MNSHLELLWSAAFKPSAAVDLAKQHPSPYRLGWIYVGILTATLFVCELIAKYVLRPVFNSPVEPATPGFEWIDSVLGNTLLSGVCYSLMYVFQRWFWRKFAGAGVSHEAVDASIVAGFAISTLILLPEYVLMEAMGTVGVFLPMLGLLFCIGVGVVYYTLYFSHGLKLSRTKSFWLNILLVVLFFLVLIFVFVIFTVIYAALTGTSFEAMFGPPEIDVDV
jgi:hypothetical protein